MFTNQSQLLECGVTKIFILWVRSGVPLGI